MFGYQISNNRCISAIGLNDIYEKEVLNDIIEADVTTPQRCIEFSVRESNECSIFFASINTEKGICLWKGEYDSCIYVW